MGGASPPAGKALDMWEKTYLSPRMQRNLALAGLWLLTGGFLALMAQPL